MSCLQVATTLSAVCLGVSMSIAPRPRGLVAGAPLVALGIFVAAKFLTPEIAVKVKILISMAQASRQAFLHSRRAGRGRAGGRWCLRCAWNTTPHKTQNAVRYLA